MLLFFTCKYPWKLAETGILQSYPISQDCSMNRTLVSPYCS